MSQIEKINTLLGSIGGWFRMNAEKKEAMLEEENKILGMSKINFFLVCIIVAFLLFLGVQALLTQPKQEQSFDNLPSMDDKIADLRVKIYTIPYTGERINSFPFNETGLVPLYTYEPEPIDGQLSYGEVCGGYVPTSSPIKPVQMETVTLNGSDYFCAQTTFEYDQIEFGNTTYEIGFTEEECKKATVTQDYQQYLNLSFIKEICIQIPANGMPEFE